jgi:hypothetical protein
LDDDFPDRHALLLESTLVVSTLMLSITVDAFLNLPAKCANGTDCETLLNVDAALWGLSSAVFLFSVGAGWINMVGASMVPRSKLPAFTRDNPFMISSPHTSFVVGLEVLPFARPYHP